MKKALFFVSFLICSREALSQQDPHFTQYMTNMSIVNPAYAMESPSFLSLGLLYRSQWAGIEGAPKSLSMFGHLPVNNKIETGLSFVSDDIGDGELTETNFSADFAYILQMNEKQKLSFGIKAGFSSLNTNFSDFTLTSGGANSDQAFAQNVSENLPIIGAGLYFFTDSYYLGISIPNLLNGSGKDSNSRINSFGVQKVHTFFNGGYVFNVGDSFKIKPAFMTIIVQGAPVELDLTANVLYNEKFGLGLAYRVNDAVSMLMTVNVTPSLKLGYAYDYTTTNLRQFDSGSHEFILQYSIDLLGKGYDKSPRFF